MAAFGWDPRGRTERRFSLSAPVQEVNQESHGTTGKGIGPIAPKPRTKTQGKPWSGRRGSPNPADGPARGKRSFTSFPEHHRVSLKVTKVHPPLPQFPPNGREWSHKGVTEPNLGPHACHPVPECPPYLDDFLGPDNRLLPAFLPFPFRLHGALHFYKGRRKFTAGPPAGPASPWTALLRFLVAQLRRGTERATPIMLRRW